MSRQVMRRVAPMSVRHVRPVTRASEGLLGRVFAAMADADTPPAPPLIVHAAVPEVMAGFWLFAREVWLAGPAPRPAREAVAAGVSEANRCPFCIEVHHTALRAARKPEDAALAWGRATARPGAPELARPPFPAEFSAQFIGTAMLFHYLNRVVEVLLTDSPFPTFVARLGRVGQFAGERTLGAALVGIQLPPGGDADLLPPAKLPAELPWAEQNPHVAAALAKFVAAVERAANVPPGVRDLLNDELASWAGAAPELGRSVLDDTAERVAPANRAAARLALTVAVAPWQVDDALVADYRAVRGSDAELVGLVAAAALAAARRVSTWIADP
jgi:AhpD family alkylhydroperoxidase